VTTAIINLVKVSIILVIARYQVIMIIYGNNALCQGIKNETKQEKNSEWTLKGTDLAAS